MTTGKRGGTPEEGRRRRQAGHDDATHFAELIGVSDYTRDQTAKKDVVDPSGDTHSVKSGEKKWQVFLYRRNRFLSDDGFQALNGVGQLLIHCIDAFPPRYEDYRDNKDAAKLRLQTPMRELKDRFQRKALLRAFLMKSIFNGGEVNYLTILHAGLYRVYWNNDVVTAMANAFAVENSKARGEHQFDDQKVLFKNEDKNVGELEMRNDSERHYGEVRFNMYKDRVIELLDAAAFDEKLVNYKIKAYGHAIKTFWQWKEAASIKVE